MSCGITDSEIPQEEYEEDMRILKEKQAEFVAKAAATESKSKSKSCNSSSCACRSSDTQISSSSSAACSSSCANDAVLPAKPLATSSKLCSRCGTSPSQCVNRSIPHCWPCFEHLFLNKLKTNILKKSHPASEQLFSAYGPSGIYPRLLVACSGGPSSYTLVHALDRLRTFQPSARKSPSIEFDIIWIDDSILRYSTKAEQVAYQEQMKDLMSTFSCKLFVIPLSLIYALTPNKSDSNIFTDGTYDHLPEKQSDEEALRFIIETCPAAYPHLVRRLISHVAQSLGYPMVVSGVNATRSVVEMMKSLLHGRGAQVASMNGYFSHHFNIRWCFPFHDVMGKQVSYYTHFHHLKLPAKPSIKMSASDHALDVLTLQFIVKLDQINGQTVSNVMRTCDKLMQIVEDPENKHSLCSLCGYLISELSDAEESALGALHGLSETVLALHANRTTISSGSQPNSSLTLCHSCNSEILPSSYSRLPPVLINNSS